MPDAAGYLPPVVARLIGDATNLIRVLEDAKARLADFAKDAANAKIGGDDAPLIADLRAARAEVIDFSRKTYNVTIGADVAPALADLAKLRAEIKAMKANVRVSTRPTAGTLAAGSLGKLFGTGNRGVLGGLLWGNTGGGFISRLLSPLTAISTMFSAGFGSVGSFAGFGPEHLAMTLGGLVGSGGEALAGGGLLGLGALGKDIVGGGADTLANATARNAVAQYKQLAQTVAEYGKNSTEAKHQANLLAYSLRGDSAAARSAAKGVATASSALVNKWHAASSGAQQQSDKLMRSVLNLASAYAGRVGKAAQANLSIINSGLKPLFKWLKGPGGVGVFNTLEHTFKRELPTAVHAFDEGMKLLLRTMALIAPKTGGFIKDLDKLFTRMNTKSGFAKWRAEINKLIGDFHMWGHFLHALGHDLHSLFKDDAGEPAAIITGLTKALQNLGKWEDSTAGKKSIMSVFTSHKSEILALGRDIGEIAKSFGKIYLVVAPAFVTAVATILKAITPLLTKMSKNPAGVWILGLGLLAAKFGLLRGVLTGFGKSLGGLAAKGVKSLALLVPRLGAAAAGMLGLSAATDAEAASEDVAAASSAALNIALGVGILGAVIALGLGIYELVKHWKTVWAAIKRVTSDVWSWLKSVFSDGLNFIENLWSDISGAFVDGWDHVKSWTKSAVTGVVNFFKTLWHDASSAVSSLVNAVVGFFKSLWHDVERAVIDGNISVISHFKTLWHDVSSAVSSMVHAVVGFFKNLWHYVTLGVSSGVSHIVGFFKNLWHGVSSAVSNMVHAVVGFFKNLWHYVTLGVSSGVSHIVGFFRNLWHDVSSAVSKMVHAVVGFFKNLWHDIERAVIAGNRVVISHFKALWHDVSSAVSSMVHAVVGFFKSLWHDVKTAVVDGASVVVSHFKTLWHDVSSAVSSMFHAVVRFFKNLWHDVETAVIDGAKVVVKRFKNLWHDVSSAVSHMFHAVVNFFKNLWHDVTSGVSSGVRTVVNWFKGLPGKIVHGLGNLRKTLLNAGKQLIMGLVHGVESMVGTVVHSVTGAVSKAYHSVLGFLGIHSPSRLFSEGVGKPIAAGIAQGITKGMPGVSSSLQQLTGLAKAPNLSLSGGGASSPLSRVEGLLAQLLSESRKSSDLAKQTADNTKATVAATKGLSSPAGVQAQMRKSNGQLITALRAGVA